MYGLSCRRSKYSLGVFGQHHRRERPKPLAELDLQVHVRLHRRRAGIAQDRPRAEGPRAELHPARGQSPRPCPPRSPPRSARHSSSSLQTLPHRAQPPQHRVVVRRDAGGISGPRNAPRMPSGCGTVRGCLSRWCQNHSAAPSAPPASPAAGCVQSDSNGPSHESLPVATQLSATPPASARCRQPRALDARSGPSAESPRRRPPARWPPDPSRAASGAISGGRGGPPNSR